MREIWPRRRPASGGGGGGGSGGRVGAPPPAAGPTAAVLAVVVDRGGRRGAPPPAAIAPGPPWPQRRRPLPCATRRAAALELGNGRRGGEERGAVPAAPCAFVRSPIGTRPYSALRRPGRPSVPPLPALPVPSAQGRAPLPCAANRRRRPPPSACAQRRDSPNSRAPHRLHIRGPACRPVGCGAAAQDRRPHGARSA